MSDPETRRLADNWQELKTRHLRLLPVPKLLAFESDPVILSGVGERTVAIVVAKQSRRSDIAVNEIQSRMDDFSARLRKTFTVTDKKLPGAYNIVIENHWPNTFTRDRNIDPKASNTDQSYGLYPTEDGILLSGHGEMGMLYAAVTLRYLMAEKDGKVILYPARVQDWPDYKNRQLGQFLSPYQLTFVNGHSSPDQHLQSMKKYVDWMFRMKGNAVFHHTIGSKVFSSRPDTLPVSANEMAMANAVSDYARLRGIRTMHHGNVRLGIVGQDDDRPGFRDMMIARGGKDYHSWARHDLHRNKAANMSKFLVASGFDMAFLHAVDGGGILDPEMWSQRDPLTRKVYGNDRVQADADMFGIYAEEFKKRGKELILVAYPYSAGNLDPEVVLKTTRLGRLPGAQTKAQRAIDGLTQWMRGIDSEVDRSIRMCVREDNRERLRQYLDIYADRPAWIYWETAHYTKSIRPLIASSVRSIGSGYFENRPAEDMIWINTLDYRWFDEQIQQTAAEFSWNTKFPGWSDYDPAYRNSGGVQVDDANALDILSERAAVGLWGDEAGQYLKNIFNKHMSWKVAIDPYEATKKLDPKVLPGLVERNHDAVDRAIDAMDRLWARHVEKTAQGKKLFDDFSYPYFIQYWVMTKAAKAYSDMHLFKLEIQNLSREGRSDEAHTILMRAMRQADINEANYKATLALVRGKPWVYRDNGTRDRYPQWQLIEPDFPAIRQELNKLTSTRKAFPGQSHWEPQASSPTFFDPADSAESRTSNKEGASP
jgi:hypothetical protein